MSSRHDCSGVRLLFFEEGEASILAWHKGETVEVSQLQLLPNGARWLTI